MADKQIDLQKATADWIAAILQYATIANLTISRKSTQEDTLPECLKILALADHLAENQKKYPL